MPNSEFTSLSVTLLNITEGGAVSDRWSKNKWTGLSCCGMFWVQHSKPHQSDIISWTLILSVYTERIKHWKLQNLPWNVHDTGELINLRDNLACLKVTFAFQSTLSSYSRTLMRFNNNNKKTQSGKNVRLWSCRINSAALEIKNNQKLFLFTILEVLIG